MEQDAAARERLRTLVGSWGREVVRLKLELREAELDAVLSGEHAMDAHTRQRFVDVWRELGGDDPEDLGPALIAEEEERVWKRDEEEGDEEEGDEEVGDEEVQDQSPSPPQSRATPEVALEALELSARPGLAGPGRQELQRMSLIRAHQTVRMALYRLRLSEREKVDTQLLMVQIEMALITYFRESFPEPGQNWDTERRDRMRERSLTLFRLLEQKQKRPLLRVEGGLEPGVGAEETDGRGSIPAIGRAVGRDDAGDGKRQ